MSGSPIPRLITSIPAARWAATLRSSSANRYGGIRSRRLLGRIELLGELGGDRAAEHRDRPARQLDAQVLRHVDLQLTPIELDRYRRLASRQHVGDGGAGGAGSAGSRLPHAPLEDPRPQAAPPRDRVPGDVGPVREQAVAFDLRPHGLEIETV